MLPADHRGGDEPHGHATGLGWLVRISAVYGQFS